MQAQERETQAKRKIRIWVSVVFVSAGALLVVYRYSRPDGAAPNGVLVTRLLNAKHYKATIPEPMFNLWVFKAASLRPASLRKAALAAIGMEPRELSAMKSGEPAMVFACLASFGGYGEIVWVDQWDRFEVEMPSPTMSLPGLVVPRRLAMQAAVRAVRASGGCFIKAGEKRYLVIKRSQKKEYEAAIRALGWIDGVRPPWEN